MERFAAQAAKALNQVLETPIAVTELEIPPDPKLGDFAFPCFKLAKSMRKAPPQIAQTIAGELQSKGVVPKGFSVSTAGPYVNFTVDPSLVFNSLIGDILKSDNYGRVAPKSKGRWVLEYSSP